MPQSTNTPDKSEKLLHDESCPLHWLPKGHAGAKCWCNASRPPADQVPDTVERVARALKECGRRASIGMSDCIWTDFATAAIAALQAVPAASGEVGWQPIESAPKDGTLVLLLVDYSGDDADHWIDDRADGTSRTIGHNNDDNVGPDEAQGWQFAGWCWTHDHYVEGRGRPTYWRPLPEPPALKASGEE